MKVCNQCKKEKKSSDFYTHASTQDGLSTYCRDCITSNMKKHYAENKERIKARKKELYTTERNFKYYLKKEYDMTVEQFNELSLRQNNCCAICKKSFNFRKPFIDHDHETGIVRGLLCPQCNAGLGQFYEDITIMKNAIEYIDDFKITIDSSGLFLARQQ